jgi:hypothetical protein
VWVFRCGIVVPMAAICQASLFACVPISAGYALDMKRSNKAERQSPVVPAPEPKADPIVTPPSTPPVTDPAQTKPSAFPGADAPDTVERISFKLVNGKLDHTSLRASTADKAREAIGASLKDDSFRSWAGVGAAAVTETPKPQIVTPQLFGVLLDGAAGLEAGVFAKKYALPIDDVKKIVAWTPADHAMLDAQGAAICNKYVPTAWLQYADIGIFAMTLLTVISMKAKMVENYAKAEVEKIGKAGSQTPGHASAPTNGAGVQPASISPGEASRSLEGPA